ncbi:MAG: 3-methyl-2-oxobutanoate dehydrogenase subunit VorB [Defluviitaleaceae bacterium]|nr:3-methyl-2-oxobutanoate dehydrogenase subunit VorB [Defluviitaleaceae bacterium]
MKGNEAISESAIKAGCRAFFGYPITPQSEIPEYMAKRMPEIGGTFIQAESEVAAINMVYGSAATGVPTMTSSSSPGIALKQEGISYLVGADLPALIVSMSRSGPGLGGILPGQADYFQATRGGGNGDYYLPVFAPNSVQEASDMVFKSFEVAYKYRTPVMILADGMLGQMMEPVELKETSGINPDISWAANGNSGTRDRNVINSLNLKASGLEAENIERFKRYEEIKKTETLVEKNVSEGDEIVIVAYGTPSRIAKNSIDELAEHGIKAGMIRPITLWPYPYDAFKDLPKSVKAILVAELSMGQMIEDVRMAIEGKIPVHFYGRTGGEIFEASEITNKALEVLGKNASSASEEAAAVACAI